MCFHLQHLLFFLFFEMQICQHPSQFDHQRKVLHEPTLAWYSPQFSAGSHQVFVLTNAGLESRNNTHQKINMERKNEDLEDDFPLRGVIFRFNVSFQGSQGSTLDSKFYNSQTHSRRILRFFTFTVQGFSHWDGHLQMRKTPEFTMNSLGEGRCEDHTLTLWHRQGRVQFFKFFAKQSLPSIETTDVFNLWLLQIL